MIRAKEEPGIPAVGYLRKSTAGERPDGRERQEKSIPAQRAEIEKLAKSQGFEIIRWYADPGVSGWKRGAKRPDFARMLKDAQEHRDFQAIVCDDLDRFSRADMDEVQSDTFALKQAGVQFIVTSAQGTYPLGSQGQDFGKMVKFMADVWGSNQFSRKLSRRLSRARRDAAKDGRRSGGNAPYGLENDGQGGLKFGEAKKIKIVRRIYKEFAVEVRSLNSIAARLNREGVPASRGGKWHVAAIKELLQRRVYRGDFVYNRRKSGQFYICDAKQNIVEATDADREKAWQSTDVGIILKKNAYKPLVKPEIWDAAQRRIVGFKMKGNRRPREKGSALAGILICDHCGKPLYGCQPKGRPRRYRCGTNAKQGMGTCGSYEILEDDILPTLLEMISEEINKLGLEQLITEPPESLVRPWSERADQREGLTQDREKLAARIARAEENLLFSEDARTRKSLDSRLSALRDELERLDGELAENVPIQRSWSRDESKALAAWWESLFERAVSVPLVGEFPHEIEAFYKPVDWEGKYDEFSAPRAIAIEPRKLNEALHAMGAEVRLRWRTEKVKLQGGGEKNRHVLSRWRIRMGEKTQDFPRGFYKVQTAAPYSGSRGADRCDSRKGRGSRPRST